MIWNVQGMVKIVGAPRAVQPAGSCGPVTRDDQ
jgi:hypothetical protein